MVLGKCLEHSSSVVREGAIFGLYQHSDQFKVLQLLIEVAKSDASPVIRELAAETVDSIVDEFRGPLPDTDAAFKKAPRSEPQEYASPTYAALKKGRQT